MKKFIKQVNEYYPTYLLAHQHPVNKLLHMIGNIVVVGLAVLLVYFGVTVSPFVLALLPFHLTYTIYLFAWTGHLLIEKNEPATWKVSRWITKACDWKMMFELVTFQMKWDTRERLNEKLIEMAIQKVPASLVRNVGHIELPESQETQAKTWIVK